MIRSNSVRLPLLLALLLTACPMAAAQQGAREALAGLPDAQVVLYVDAQRLAREALPRVLPPGEWQKAAEKLRQAQVELNNVEYALAAVRLPANFTPQTPPDFLAVVKGGFNADALLTLVRLGVGQGLRQETHAGKTLDILNNNVKSGPAPPFIAFTALEPDALLVGTPEMVRATLDARSSGGSGGGPRLKPALVDLATRDADALMSVAVEVPAGAYKMFQSASGMGANAEAEKIVGWIKQVQASLRMTPTDFALQTRVRTDSAEHARQLSGLAALGLSYVQNALESQLAKNPKATDQKRVYELLKSISPTTEEGDVLLSVSLPQSSAAELVRAALAPPPKPPATAQKPAAAQKPTPAKRPAPARRRGARRKG